MMPLYDVSERLTAVWNWDASGSNVATELDVVSLTTGESLLLPNDISVGERCVTWPIDVSPHHQTRRGAGKRGGSRSFFLSGGSHVMCCIVCE